jgi:uncharacterized iron-regulated membrane protein
MNPLTLWREHQQRRYQRKCDRAAAEQAKLDADKAKVAHWAEVAANEFKHHGFTVSEGPYTTSGSNRTLFASHFGSGKLVRINLTPNGWTVTSV